VANSLADLRRQFWLANTSDTDDTWSSADLERKYLMEQLGITESVLTNTDLEMTFHTAHVSP
jgi:hypothetical protein